MTESAAELARSSAAFQALLEQTRQSMQTGTKHKKKTDRPEKQKTEKSEEAQNEKKKKNAEKPKPKQKKTPPPHHPTVGHAGVSITAEGELKPSVSEGKYSWETYFPASKIMLTSLPLRIPVKKDPTTGKDMPYLAMVTNDREQYEINNCPSVVDFRRALDTGLAMLHASDLVQEDKSASPLPKWSPEHVGSEKAHFRLADPGKGMAAGLHAMAWGESPKTRHTVPLLRKYRGRGLKDDDDDDDEEEEKGVREDGTVAEKKEEPILLYVVGTSKEEMMTEPYISQFVPEYGIPGDLIVARADFLKREMEVLEGTKSTEDGTKAPVREIRSARRNLVYANGTGSLDNVFPSELFPSIHTMMGFGRADMLYPPTEKDLPTAYKMAIGKSDPSGPERRKFMKSYLTEDLMRHFSFASVSHDAFTAKVKAVHASEQKDVKEEDINKHFFGDFSEYFIMTRLIQSLDSKHCLKVRTPHRTLTESVQRAKDDAKAAAIVPNDSAAAAVPPPAVAAAAAASTAKTEPSKAADLVETLYSAAPCPQNKWWVFTIQKIPPEHRKLLTEVMKVGNWSWGGSRLLARRIATLWKQELETKTSILKIPPGHTEPIIYQEDVRNYIRKFAAARVGWHFRAERSFGGSFSLWSAYACPGEKDKKHDHNKCEFGLYMHHIIDDIPMPIPEQMRFDTKHELEPVIQLLTMSSYQETALSFRAVANKLKTDADEAKKKTTTTKTRPKPTEMKQVVWSKDMEGATDKERADLLVTHSTLLKMNGDHKLNKGEIQKLMNTLASADRKARTPTFALRKMLLANSVPEAETEKLIKALQAARKVITPPKPAEK